MSRLARAFGAGVGGALAYLAAQELDRRLVNRRSDDLILLGGLVTQHRAVWRPLGLVMHLLAGGVFGLIFETIAAPRLPGPLWLRGIIMAQTENLALFPLLLPIDAAHPAIASGELSPTFRGTYFGQAVWRHLALGAAMGALLAPSRAPR